MFAPSSLILRRILGGFVSTGVRDNEAYSKGRMGRSGETKISCHQCRRCPWEQSKEEYGEERNVDSAGKTGKEGSMHTMVTRGDPNRTTLAQQATSPSDVARLANGGGGTG
jgi:hypothetical protein